MRAKARRPCQREGGLEPAAGLAKIENAYVDILYALAKAE